MKIVALTRHDGSVITSAPFTWRSSDTSLAVVDAAGTIFGLGVGTVTISAELDGHTNVARLRVVGARVDRGIATTSASQGTGQVCALDGAGAIVCLPSFTADSLPALATTTGAHPAFVALSATYSHMCGVTPSGELYCAGSNRLGQLATGRTDPSRVSDFVRAGGDQRFSAVSVGGGSTSAGHTCAIERSASVVFCAGDGSDGQTGHEPGTITFELVDSAFAPVQGNFAAIEVSAGRYHTCAIGLDRGAYCWGLNSQGVTGVGVLPINLVSTPSLIPGGHTFAHISAGSHACGVTTDGAVYCWGSNQGGQLGTGAKDNDFHTEPVLVALPAAALRVFAGNGFTCALVGAGDLYCWGLLPTTPALAARLGARALSPIALFTGVRFSALNADANHLCGLTTSQAMVCL